MGVSVGSGVWVGKGVFVGAGLGVGSACPGKLHPDRLVMSKLIRRKMAPQRGFLRIWRL
jgi:tetrahydrodipicolinate N-succinyltransferase